MPSDPPISDKPVSSSGARTHDSSPPSTRVAGSSFPPEGSLPPISREQLTSLALQGALGASGTRSIVASMRMNLDYLEEQLRRASQREVSQLSSLGVTDLLNVVFELRRGTRLIEELSHDAETGADAEADWTDLRFSLLSAVRTARVEIPERVNVVTDFGHTHRARGRATRLEYAFLTLILNAARAVRDHTECPTIRVATRNLGADRLLAIVSDTGPGIHPAELERIFDPFFEAQDGSAGFGFCICQKLVAEAGGEIWVESEVGRGTRFGIELLTVPADKADLDTLRPLPQPFVVAEAPRRIFRKSNY